MVLFLVIMFQSCAAGIGEALTGDEGNGSGSGSLVAWLMLIAGIIAVCTRKNVVGAYIAAGFYGLAGIIGISSIGSIFADLVIWGVVSAIFAIVFVIAGVVTKNAMLKDRETNTVEEEQV